MTRISDLIIKLEFILTDHKTEKGNCFLLRLYSSPSQL